MDTAILGTFSRTQVRTYLCQAWYRVTARQRGMHFSGH